MRKRYIDHYKAEQPKKCIGCIWGRWDGMKQYCSKINCVKPALIEKKKLR